MSDTAYVWSVSEQTQKFLTKIDFEIASISEEVSGGHLLLGDTNEKIVKEYSYNVGKLDGLKVLKEYVENLANDDDSEALSGEIDSRVN